MAEPCVPADIQKLRFWLPLNSDVRGHVIARQIAIAIVSSACAPALGQVPACPSARDVSAEIKRTGATATLNAAHANSQRWSCVLNGIESATPAWLSVASRLRSASDAGTSSELGVATVVAFEKNPRAVLAIVREESSSNRLSVKTVCNPAIEPQQGYLAYFNQTEAKVEAIQLPELHAKKQKCLEIVRTARVSHEGGSK